VKTGKGETWAVNQDGRVSSHTSAGLDVDGYIAPLDGEPPVAKSQGWGDLTFLYAPAYGGD
jgi:hypothetical protein